jgi:microcompartment protein CcmK/EutM
VRCAVVAPTRHPALTGARLLLVAVREGGAERLLVAVDTVGAGPEDAVLVATGSHAVAVTRPEMPADAVIVGLVEDDLVP